MTGDRRDGRATASRTVARRSPSRTARAIIRNAEAELQVDAAAATAARDRPTLRSGALAPPRADPAQGRRGLHGDRPARGLQDARRRPRASRRARRRSATSSRCSRSTACSPTRTRQRGPRADRRRAPLLRRPPARQRRARLPAARARLGLQLVRREVDEAMRVTSETLSQVTNLLAIVSAPPSTPRRSATSRSSLLQPQVLMVVVITSTGGVTKRVFTFERPVDPGLAQWAAEYLNERLTGMGLGARMLHSRLADPCARRERARVPRRASRPPSPSWPRRPRTRSTSTAPRACSASTASRTSARSTS